MYYIFILHQTTTIASEYGPTTLLYYIFILHQTTTVKSWLALIDKLYYIFILHQTTTRQAVVGEEVGCIISSFYIKPQQVRPHQNLSFVVLYLHSTSNHNLLSGGKFHSAVVLYLHSTSNHNAFEAVQFYVSVVLYLHSTSNHNFEHFDIPLDRVVLYLHSTSNHNHPRMPYTWTSCCIISSFYIKPQQGLLMGIC